MGLGDVHWIISFHSIFYGETMECLDFMQFSQIIRSVDFQISFSGSDWFGWLGYFSIVVRQIRQFDRFDRFDRFDMLTAGMLTAGKHTAGSLTTS